MDRARICIVERIRISYFLTLSHMAMFYATTEQKFIHFEMPWEFVGRSTNYTKVRSMHRLCTTLHKAILGFADIGSMEKKFWFFFCITPHTRKIKKSTVEFHTSKNILKIIKQSNQSCQVEKYFILSQKWRLRFNIRYDERREEFEI